MNSTEQIALGLRDPETGKLIEPPSSVPASVLAIDRVLNPVAVHTTDEYQTAAMRTEAPSDDALSRMDVDKMRLLHGLIGLTTEVGELMDLIKRHLFYSDSPALSKEAFAEELGDLQWYLAIVHSALGIQPSMTQKANIAKLLKRYPEKYADRSALQRNVAIELAEVRKYLASATADLDRAQVTSVLEDSEL